MKTSIFPTRSSLAATAARNVRWFAAAVAGSGLAHAGTWTGTVSSDWNNASNWSGGLGGTAQISITPANIATITADFTVVPTQIVVANGGTAVGRVDHRSGNASVATGNDVSLGRSGGNATYNLANTGVPAAGLTGFAIGSGSLTIPDQLWVGGVVSGVSTGTLNINTSGTIAVGTQLLVGNLAGTGTVRLQNGTVTVASELEIGNGAGATGTWTQSGGTLTKTGSLPVSIGGGIAAGGGNGTASFSGGTFTSSANVRVGHGSGSVGSMTVAGGTLNLNGEFWIGSQTGGTGTLTVSSGTIASANWCNIGRKDDSNPGSGGSGTVTMTGGTWTKSGDSNFIVGDTGNGSMTHSGGLVDVLPSPVADRGITWIGNRNACTGTLTVSGTAEFRSPRFVVALESGTTGTLNLDGGTIRTRSITGGIGNSTVLFNGTTIVASDSSDSFLENLVIADIAAGGLKVDSAGHSLEAFQAIGGTGTVTKSGAGTLRLSGSNLYDGDHIVNGGTLMLSVSSAADGSTTVADGAGFGAIQEFGSGTLNQDNLTLGSGGGASLSFDLGDNPGNPFDAPLNVTGTVTLNGPVTVHVADLDPALGTIPLLTYSAKAGSGSFVTGTLPLGVTGNIVDDGSTVSLEITGISFPVWTGATNDLWDTNPANLNWQDELSFSAIPYANGLPVVFDDLALPEDTNVVLNSTVTPGSVTFDSFGNAYTLSGTGKISGSTGLIVSGAANITINTANDFTGPVRIDGGTVSFNTPAAFGAGSSPVVLNGGTLNSTGGSGSTNRGLTYSLAGTLITTTGNVTFNGPVNGSGGSLVKEGTGTLGFVNGGSNVLGTAGNGVLVHDGTLLLGGGGSFSSSGEMWVADLPDRPANLVLDNATLTTASWIAIGRGNGDNGVTNLTATNSTINSVNYSTGFNNGLGNNQSEAFVTLNDSTWNNNGLTYLAESSGSQGVMTLNGNSKYNITNNFILARFLGTTATVNLNGTSSVTKTGGYTAIGNEGTAVMNVNDTASFTALSGDFNVGDIGSSKGTINLAGSGLVNVTQVFIGKNITTTGTLNQTGGTFQSANFITIGAFTGGTGTVNISAGSLTAATNINVGQSGNGTLNVSGSAQVTASGDAVFIGSAAGGTGTLNLNGGTVTAKRVGEGAAATSTLNFNGGLLKAAAGANAAFIGPVDNAVIQPGGAFIDTSGQNLSVTAALGGTGALTKSGAGTLTLSGGHSYGGNTTVTAGTLALSTATLADSSTVTIAAGAALNLPHGASDTVAGLVINGSSLGAGVYSAATHPGIITGTGSLNVTGTGGSPYDTWIAGFPSIPAADRDPGDDPDGDGATNAMEFALGGIPNSGSSRPKVYPLVADSSADGDTTREMLLTIAVLSGTPAFSGSPSPTATQSGYTYAIEGSTTLGAFTTAAVPVTPVVTGLPAAPAGYEYRTFSLSGSNGVPGKGFLRVNVTP